MQIIEISNNEINDQLFIDFRYIIHLQETTQAKLSNLVEGSCLQEQIFQGISHVVSGHIAQTPFCSLMSSCKM